MNKNNNDNNNSVTITNNNKATVIQRLFTFYSFCDLQIKLRQSTFKKEEQFDWLIFSSKFCS